VIGGNSAGTAIDIGKNEVFYGGFFWSSTPIATEANVAQVLSVDGTAKNLRVKVGTVPGSGKPIAFTVMRNGAATGLTCSIETTTTCVDATNTQTFVAGDLISIKISAGTGDPANPAYLSWAIEYR
jgi:hypothetical protein